MLLLQNYGSYNQEKVPNDSKFIYVMHVHNWKLKYRFTENLT